MAPPAGTNPNRPVLAIWRGPVARRFLLAFALLLAAAAPAAAHKLKVFATVEGGTISGYAFFVGGGRPHGAHVAFRDDAGQDLSSTVTDEDGAFAFTPARPEAITVLVDAGDGHSAETHIAAERLAPLALPTEAPAQSAAPSASASAGGTAESQTPGRQIPGRQATAPPAAPGCDSALIGRLVDMAVARQIRPLLEAQEAAQDKLRFNDVAGGIGMIVGLAGAALWATSRRKAPPAPPRT